MVFLLQIATSDDVIICLLQVLLSKMFSKEIPLDACHVVLYFTFLSACIANPNAFIGITQQIR